jgi:hypothetical protein
MSRVGYFEGILQLDLAEIRWKRKPKRCTDIPGHPEQPGTRSQQNADLAMGMRTACLLLSFHLSTSL